MSGPRPASSSAWCWCTVTGWLWLDPLLAIGVALNILREGAHLAWRSVEGLMDSAVEPEVRAQIDRTLAQFAHHTIRFDHLVTRRAGQRRFVDLHMHMPSSWTLGRAAALRTQRRAGADERGAGPARVDPAAADGRGGALRRQAGSAVIALVQRVVAGAGRDRQAQTVGAIGPGLLVLVCAEPHDSEALADKLVAKLLKLRIFSDAAGKMNRSVQDVQAAC